MSVEKSKCGSDCIGCYCCYVCEDLRPCSMDRCQRKNRFLHNGNGYILCKNCYPVKTKKIIIEQPNENYDDEVKKIKKKIDKILKNKEELREKMKEYKI